MSQVRQDAASVSDVWHSLVWCISVKLDEEAPALLGRTRVWWLTLAIPQEAQTGRCSKLEASPLCIASLRPSWLLGVSFAHGAQPRDSKDQGGGEPGTLEELVVLESITLSLTVISLSIYLCRVVFARMSVSRLTPCDCWSLVSVAKQVFESNLVG